MTFPDKPNKNRILAAFRRKGLDRVANFEVLVDNPTVHHVLGRDNPGQPPWGSKNGAFSGHLCFWAACR
jgi:hypothetical protein